MTRYLSTACIILLSLLLFGCPPREADVVGGRGNEILIGQYGSLTGTTATFGQSTNNGIMLAIGEINEAGGVNGRPIRVVTEDTQSKPEEAANAVSKLISQNRVLALLGEVASSRTLAAAPIAQANRVPMISPASTNPEVTRKGDYIFRVSYIDPYQGEALARFVRNELGLSRAAVLTDMKNDYSVGLSEYFQTTFRELGGQILIEQSYSEGDSDFRAQLTRIRGLNPEVIFIPGYYTEIGQIAIQARDLGMNQPLVGGDGWESPRLIEIGGRSLEGSYYSTAFSSESTDPLARKFVESYRERYGQVPDALAALGYDAARVLADALGRAEALDGPSIRDAIAQTRNFPGVTGSITIDENRNAIKPLVVLKVEGGQLRLAAVVPPPTDGVAEPQLVDSPATTAPPVN